MEAVDESLQHKEQSLHELPASEPVEAPAVRRRRHVHRTGLYVWAFALVAILVVVIALAVVNIRQVKLSWVIGTSHASLVWVILATAILGGYSESRPASSSAFRRAADANRELSSRRARKRLTIAQGTSTHARAARRALARVVRVIIS